MELFLTYRGPLPSAQGKGNGRKNAQLAMRRDFHHQLLGVWQQWPFLQSSSFGHFERLPEKSAQSDAQTFYKAPVGRFFFVPLVVTGSTLKLVARLTIKLLSRDEPGSIVHQGDLDNRLKILFDALTVPQANQLPEDAAPAQDEIPLLCLLEDDKLITALSVTTGTLLRPPLSEEEKNDVELDISVDVKTSEKSRAALRL
jgi:hypothetical protein